MPILASKMIFWGEGGEGGGWSQFWWKQIRLVSSIHSYLWAKSRIKTVRKRNYIVARRAFFTRLVEQAQKTKFFWIDDAWVTGMLGKHRKTHRKHAKCRHVKNWPVKGLCGRCLFVWFPEPHPPPPTHCLCLYKNIQYTYSNREGGGESWTREKGSGATVYKARSKIPTWLTVSPVYKLWYSPAAKSLYRWNF